MRLGTALFALAIMMIPRVSEAQNIGLKVTASGAIQPIVQHAAPDRVSRATPTAFAIEVNGLYRLPIDAIAIDVGIGARYLFQRSEGRDNTYSLVPIYAIVQIPFSLPSFGDGWSIYIDGRLGYSFFLPSSAYRAAYSSTNVTNVVGGVVLGVGLGTAYQITKLLDVRAGVLYSYNLNESGDTRIEVSTFDVSIGAGFSF